MKTPSVFLSGASEFVFAWLLTGVSLSGQQFSANAALYVDLDFPTGINLVSNPLEAEDNSIGHLFSGVPLGTIFVPANPLGIGFGPTNYFTMEGWSDPVATLIQPNAGLLILPSPVRLSFAGVEWGTSTNFTCLFRPAGTYVLGLVPGNFVCDLWGCRRVPLPGTELQKWNAVAQQSEHYLYLGDPEGWVNAFGEPADPRIEAGEAGVWSVPGVFCLPTVFLSPPGRRDLVDPRHDGTNFTARFVATEPTAYSLLRSTNLNSERWDVIEPSGVSLDGRITVYSPTNSQEFYRLHGAFPADRTYLEAFSRTGSVFRCQFHAQPGTNYVVERRLDPNSWVAITNLVGNGEMARIADSNATARTNVYRLRF